MIGAVLGEIIGSANVHRPWNTGDSPLFPAESPLSEEAVLSMALADALLQNKEYTRMVPAWEIKYREERQGLFLNKPSIDSSLRQKREQQKGVALHAYLLGYACYRLDDVLEKSAQIASVSHEHYANTHVVQAVATGVFLANNRFSKRYIKAFYEDQYGFDLSVPYNELTEEYQHQEQPMVSVYRALIALLQSGSFDDALRISISIGDPENKQAFITGAIAEAFYKDYPDASVHHIMSHLPKEMQQVVKAFNQKFGVKAKEKFYEKLA
jgi:ADP-ribosyl-[dinitrogen reductase] hydrolase